MANLTLAEIKKGIVPKAGNAHAYKANAREVRITITPATGRGKSRRGKTVRFNWHFRQIEGYNYVTIYRVKNEIYFNFSNTLSEEAYTVSQKRTSSVTTSVCGTNADTLEDFAGGTYTLREYSWWDKRGEAMYYITKEGEQ